MEKYPDDMIDAELMAAFKGQQNAATIRSIIRAEQDIFKPITPKIREH